MEREKFDFNTYMEDCATRLKDLEHTSESPCFFRSNSILGLEELLNNIGVASYPALVIQTAVGGTIGDEARSNNFLDNPFYSFYIIGAPLQGSGDADTTRLMKDSCKSIGFKILAKMRHDRLRQQKGLHFMKLLSVPYQEVGPLGAGSYGVMFHFEVPEHSGLPHNTEDWLPEE